MKYLLDTNVFIHAVKNLGRIREQLKKRHPEDLATSVVTLAELLHGAQKTPDPEKTRQKWLAALQPFSLVAFTEQCAQDHASIRYALRHRPIGERDLLIASIARGYDLTVVSNNAAEFSRVPGLRYEDWH